METIRQLFQQFCAKRDALYAPSPGYLPAGKKSRQQQIGALIGYGLFLFFFTISLPYIFPGAWFAKPNPVLGSVSAHFFHRQLGLPFVVLLVFVSVFLLCYAGENHRERLLARISAFGALLLTFFPVACVCNGVVPATSTDAVQTFSDMSWPLYNLGGDDFTLFPGVNIAHYAGAILLFGALIFQASVVFTRITDLDRDDPNRLWWKLIRNRFYYATAIAMAAALFFTLFGPLAKIPGAFYWGELAAMALFGIAWIIKGRFGVTFFGQGL